MSEQLIGHRMDVDLSEELFDALRERALRFNDEQVVPGHDEFFQVRDSQLVPGGGAHFYELAVDVGTSDKNLGRQLQGVEFRLSELSIIHLEPEMALNYVRRTLPQGEALVDNMREADRQRVSGGDGARLSVLWQYAVNSFYPGIIARNEIQLVNCDKEGERNVLRQVIVPDRPRACGLHFLRRHCQTQDELRTLRGPHMVDHINHILLQLQLPEPKVG